MLKEFPEWYKLASLDTPKGRLEERWNAVESFGKSLSGQDIKKLVLLQCGFNLDNDDMVNRFVDKIRETDETFTYHSNEFEMRVLAGSLLGNQLDSSDKLKDTVLSAYLLHSLNFQAGKMKPLLPQLADKAFQFICNNGQQQRDFNEIKTPSETPNLDFEKDVTNDWKTIQSYFNQVKNGISLVLRRQNALMRDLDQKLKVQQEETNILWWLYGEYSNILRKRFQEMKNTEMCFIVAKELFSLTQILPEPVSADGFLKKALKLCSGDGEKISLKDIINKTDRDIRRQFIKEFSELDRGETLPISFGFLKSLETESEDDWVSFFEKSTGIKAKSKLNISRFSYQFYQELICHKLLREINE